MIEIEKDIINRCRQKERKAQMHLYATLSRRVYNSCYRILNDSFDAEDAMQESFLKVFSGLDHYDDNIPFVAWVTRIAINASIDKLRTKKLDFVQLDNNMGGIEEDDDDWEDTMEKVEKIKKAISELPDAARVIVTLYLIEGYDHEEISEILHVKAGTVRIQYMRAKQRLLEILKTA
ncbi:RNA polymerase sigma factor [Dysgonomonas sp. 25]|uniref:RNA polymerase sigma factor n=1 Tax=Dysgonomonas sp. 25 TaxID=2302933 RepID=UPI0013D8CB19|nr:RNA polymerase sigma factor [Dysgonomonas sp. 25]NDV70282.1 RNA polymerase sigma factor [Dysgonomonas sp. 25]